MSEGVKYRALKFVCEARGGNIPEWNDARVELAAAERTALDYARIDALRLAAEKEVDVLAGELEVARKRIADLTKACESALETLSPAEFETLNDKTCSIIRAALGGQS